MRAGRAVAFAFVLCLAGTGPGRADPSPPGSRLEACARALVDPRAWRAASGQSWDLFLERPEGGALAYLGAEHYRPPEDPQFDRMAAVFAGVNPTVAFYEGPPPDAGRPPGPDRREAIRGAGEPGWVRLLAARANVPARSLEPDQASLLRALAERFPPEQVELFYLLRPTAQLKERFGADADVLRASMARRLPAQVEAARRAGIEAPIRTPEALQAAYARYWPGQDWTDARLAWFNPLLDDAETGGVFLAAVNAAENRLRNRHMYEVLAGAVLNGERVFAVVGRNHVPLQAPALRCAVEGPGGDVAVRQGRIFDPGYG